jgi:hypothetical protein
MNHLMTQSTTRKDTRPKRPWIKVQCKNDPEAVQAEIIVDGWKKSKKASKEVVNAVLMYSALQRGDITELLRRFPEISMQFVGAARPAPRPLPYTDYGTPEVVTEPRDNAADLEDALDFGFEGLDFGD